MLRRNTLLSAAVLSLLALALAANPAQAQRGGVSFGAGGGRYGVMAGTTPYVPGYYRSGLYGSYGAYGSLGRYYDSSPYRWYNDPYYYYSTRQFYAPQYGSTYVPPSYAVPRYAAYPPLMAPGAEAATTSVARIQVVLPDAAGQVRIDGRQTSSTGTTRYFDSPPLEPGKLFSYTVSATFQRDGKEVTEERKVPVAAGGTQVVDFTRP